MSSSEELLQAVVAFLNSEKLKFGVFGNTVTLLMGGRAEEDSILVVIKASHLLLTITCASTSIRVPKSQIGRVCEYIAWANQAIVVGNLELDPADGQPTFRYAIDLSGVKQFKSVIKPGWHVALSAATKFFPGISKLLSQSSLSPAKAAQDRLNQSSASSSGASEALKLLALLKLLQDSKEEVDPEKPEDNSELKKAVRDIPASVTTVLQEIGTSGSEDSDIVIECLIPASEVKIVGKKIGRGGFAAVYKGDYNGTDVAVKRLLHELPNDAKEAFKKEVVMLHQLTHPNVVLMMGIWEDRGYSVVLEFMHKKSLWHVLQSEGASTPLAKKLGWILDACKGLAYIHSKKIVHGDLKTLNLLVDQHNVVKVSDFGLARMKQATASLLHNVTSFTPAYAAPEMFGGDITFASDVYAFGIIMWEVLTCKTPFLGKNLAQISIAVKQGERPVIPAEIPSQFTTLITKCWSGEVEERPTFKAILTELSAIKESLVAASSGSKSAN